MSARSRRRRERAEALPATSTAARRARRVPSLPVLAAASGVALLGAAWMTRSAPGAARESAAAANHFTVQIPADQQRVINSWQRFFICYDLTDPYVIDLTLRANQRATGSLDFPGEKVEVELPAPGAAGAAPASSGAEDELIAVRQSVVGTIAQGLAQAWQQCAGATAP
jgi:hypothetical protein